MKSFWKNKKVFITGHTGFKGSWLCFWLKYLGADILGYSLPLNENNDLFKKLKISRKVKSIYGDICDKKKLKQTLLNFEPSIIFHLAAQPIVSESYENPYDTLFTNIMGTANLLDSCFSLKKIKSIVIITSDKCYENNEKKRNFIETDNLGGDDPYSASKAACEIIVNSYSKSFFNKVGISTARSGNVIGGGDNGKNRLIPDIVESLEKNKKLKIRNPNSVRPWQHVFETLNGYILLAEKLYLNKKKYTGSWNFGPSENQKSVKYVVNNFYKIWGVKANYQQINSNLFKEKKKLSLNSYKAQKYLGWKNKWSNKEAINEIVKWYKILYDEGDIYNFSKKQLINFINNE